MNSFDGQTQAFVNWLVDEAKIKISDKVEVQDLRAQGQGRALVAVQDILKDEVLFEIPRECLLNAKTSSLVKDHPELKVNLEQELGHWEGLILCILYEKLVKKESSHWFPYFSILPEAEEINSLMYWNDEQLENLKPSLVLTRIGKEAAKNMFDSIAIFITTHGLRDEISPLSWDLFVHVASIIMSYSFDVELPEKQSNDQEDGQDENEEYENECIARDGYMKSMVPLADILNSNTNRCNAHLTYSSTTLKMFAIADIPKNGQIFNIYGDHPNAEILRRYGYVEWGGSKFDFAEVRLQNVADIICNKFNITETKFEKLIKIFQENVTINELLEDESIILESYDCYNDGTILPEIIILLQILCTFLSMDLVEKYVDDEIIESQLERVTKKCTQLISGGRITSMVCDLWKQIVCAREKEYPSHASREQVIQLNQYLNTDGLRNNMASEVLRNEFQCLQKCEDSIKNEFTIIDDQKLLNNVLKRKSTNEQNSMPEKRQKI
ncbi:hypothetical protein TBLA_0E03310 [Henningerozyma blattae CBS 6284]|uniref:Ribosomal lysine N-methyltransferase 4 n=1 Tax=Henningerozyma blattae (strain ATCC 34711 / CBS 6284 / DSM 70876 / NBRC 10599 / NRRL Y-10934 / UCD 77-7) TaxID=1071380 RepID=I2H4T3_HENB6|nr:hypothetical protein TBLA_0E03310 [Tetrapisispora blattae CBS 6284]CCH61385.1 hypothetical protein TBLA_0E03310 [Tetrapisispora blattae CBS 6284]